jgi:hypothetical protein
MKATKIILTASLFAVAASLAYAGPGADYWAQRRATRARAAAPVIAPAATPANTACCRVVTTQRPVASHKVTIPVKTVECGGCAAMAAGEKCPSS